MHYLERVQRLLEDAVLLIEENLPSEELDWGELEGYAELTLIELRRALRGVVLVVEDIDSI